MMPTQTYANHRSIPPAMHIVAGAILLIWSMSMLWQAVSVPSYQTWISALGTLALLPLWFYVRRNPQKMQDRIIRLEMQVRLARLMPNRDLAALTLPQLIALRFASDAELPGLVERTLRGELTTPDAIKRAVVDWQADWLRV